MSLRDMPRDLVPQNLVPETPTSPPLAADSAPPGLGVVYLVGAGPGDPDLITVQGLRCLRRAGAVVFDRLVHPALVDEAPPHALRFDCGKAPGRVRRTQADTERLLVRLARTGLTVVRLKGGDPFVFGRGGEEAIALSEAGVPWRVVPGVSSAVAAAASAGIPLTHRGVASSFAVFTGHRAATEHSDPSNSPGNGAWHGSGNGSENGPGNGAWHPCDRHDLEADTVVALMAVRRLDAFVDRLLAAGRRPDTPAALVERATLPGSRTVIAPLAELPARAAEAGIHSPATLVVGRVVGLRSALSAEPADLHPAVLGSPDSIPASYSASPSPNPPTLPSR